MKSLAAMKEFPRSIATRLLLVGFIHGLAVCAQADESETNKFYPDDMHFDRLFTRAGERKALDDIRDRGGLKRANVVGIDQNPQAEPPKLEEVIVPEAPIKLSGILLRGDGQHRVWVNGQSEAVNRHSSSTKIYGSPTQSAKVSIPLRREDQLTLLKPGQVWDPIAQRTQESYSIALPPSSQASSSIAPAGTATDAAPVSDATAVPANAAAAVAMARNIAAAMAAAAATSSTATQEPTQNDRRPFHHPK